jgi:hypothetical protein
MTDFSKAVIYGLYCKDKNVLEIYIGSARDRNKREKNHKDKWNNENDIIKYNIKLYNYIRENGGWDNWIFKVIEEYPCENRTELRIREQYHYDLLKPALNMRRPYIPEEEWEEYHKNYDAKRYQDNREKINNKKKQKHICDCGKEYTYGNKAQHCKSNKHIAFLANRPIAL